MDPNLTPPSSLVPREAPTPNTLSLIHDQSPALQPTSLAIVNGLSNELKQLFPSIDLGLGVSSVNRSNETSLQGPILGEIIRRLGLAGQLGTDFSMPIVPPNIPLVDKAAVSDAYDYNSPTDAPLRVPSPFKTVPIKTEIKYNSGSEYFPSESGASGRSSSPEEHRETFKKRLLNKQRSPQSKKKWLLGADSNMARNGERLIKAQREKMKIEFVDQKGGQSEKDWRSPEIEGSLDTDMTSTGSLHIDDVLPKWLRRDVDVLRRALLTGIEKNVDSILTSYLRSKGSIKVDETLDNSQKHNNGLGNASSRVRVRTNGNEITVEKNSDLRPIVRDHFKTLLFPNIASQASVPWKNLGVWLYSRRKRFTKWDRIIPTDFTATRPLNSFPKDLKKEQHRKMLLVGLEDWTEDEKQEPWISEIPLIVDPKNRVLVKVGDLCEMYPSQFINAIATGSTKRSGNSGPSTAITIGGMSSSYTTPSPRSQMKGKGLMTSSARCDSEFDYQ